jgi:nucleoside-diphosphate-sugar epimerase
MDRKIFLAGASGVIGRRFGPLLVEADGKVRGAQP